MSRYIKFRTHYFRKDEVIALSIAPQQDRIKWIVTITYIDPHTNELGVFTAHKSVEFGYDFTAKDNDLVKDINYIKAHCDKCEYDDDTVNIIRQLQNNRE